MREPGEVQKCMIFLHPLSLLTQNALHGNRRGNQEKYT